MLRSVPLLLLLAGCHAAPPQFEDPFHRRVYYATVSVQDEVEFLLGKAMYCEVAVAAGARTETGSLAGTDKRRSVIVYGRELDRLSDSGLRFVAAHELAHVYMCDEWEVLSPELQEGVADYVASLIVPNFHQEFDHFHLRREQYAQAFRLVRDVGLDRLRELAIEAKAQNIKTLNADWIKANIR